MRTEKGFKVKAGETRFGEHIKMKGVTLNTLDIKISGTDTENDLDFEEVKNNLVAITGVLEIGDLHIWQTGSHDRFLSVQVIVSEMDQTERIKILAKTMTLLKEKYNMHHSTIQTVSKQEITEIGLACEHCN